MTGISEGNGSSPYNPAPFCRQGNAGPEDRGFSTWAHGTKTAPRIEAKSPNSHSRGADDWVGDSLSVQTLSGSPLLLQGPVRKGELLPGPPGRHFRRPSPRRKRRDKWGRVPKNGDLQGGGQPRGLVEARKSRGAWQGLQPTSQGRSSCKALPLSLRGAPALPCHSGQGVSVKRLLPVHTIKAERGQRQPPWGPHPVTGL